MKYFFIFCSMLLMSNLHTQEIINSQFITNGVVALGQKAGIQFNVNQATLCDSYSVSWNVNYAANIIDVNVDYNYISSCEESSIVFVELPNHQMLLTGVFFVNLNLNVPTKPEWNKTFALGSISVLLPDLTSCSSSSIPVLEMFCPVDIDTVCACNGQTFTNECFAYLEGQNGNYFGGTCADHALEKAFVFECNTFTSNAPNFLELYNCSSNTFAGAEIVFLYDHTPSSPNELVFTASSNDVQLLLVNISDSDLVCTVASSSENILDLTGIGFGTHFIIADRISPGSFSVSLCDPLSALIEVKNNERSIVYPNPSNDEFNVYNEAKTIEKIQLIDVLGRIEQSYLVKGKQAMIEPQNASGIYFLKIFYQNDEVELHKVLLN